MSGADEKRPGARVSMQVIADHAQQSEEAAKAKGGGQGFWSGVVFPCMSNILGVILFLRAPWITGRAGIGQAFGLVFVCCMVTFVATLSISAIATNGKIAGGGSYYLISRSMGPALGAGVGFCFYMANSIGAAMYFMGTVESWESAVPSAQILEKGSMNNTRVTAWIILAAASLVVGFGVKYVAKLSNVFLAIVWLTILSMYLGLFIGPNQPGTSSSPYDLDVLDIDGDAQRMTLSWGGIAKIGKYFSENWGPGWTDEQSAYPNDKTIYNFASMMGLWFPANTGVFAGSNRSADLKDPCAYIPWGTLLAQLSTSFVYLSFIVLFGCVAPRETLLNDKFFASTAAWPLPQFVQFGVIASTIGAGLTSLTSGSRLLSAIAADGTLPILRFFKAKPGKEPTRALIATTCLCACAVAIGELNAVAPILTMFFLMCKGCVNLSCTVLELVQDPNWRPAWRYYHWSISLFGALQCIVMMFAMDPARAAIAIAFCGLIQLYALYNSSAVKWGDGFQGMKFQVARNILLKMDLKTHIKNWRPQILAVTEANLKEEGMTVQDPELLKFVSQLKGGRGITIVGAIVSAQGEDAVKERGFFFRGDKVKSLVDGSGHMKKLLQDNGIEGFGHALYTESYLDGLQTLIQTAGLGAFEPNCLVRCWPDELAWKAHDEAGLSVRSNLLRMVQLAAAFNKVMLVAKASRWPELKEQLKGFIDVWWIVGDGGILLLLPFLLKKHKVWAGCKTRLFLVTNQAGADLVELDRQVNLFVKDFRLDVQVKIKNLAEADDIAVSNSKAKHRLSVMFEGPKAAATMGSNAAAPAHDEGFASADATSAEPTVLDVAAVPRERGNSPLVQAAASPVSLAHITKDSVDDLRREFSSPGLHSFTQITHNDVSELRREVSGQDLGMVRQPSKDRTQFVNSTEQLRSTVPCSQDELLLAQALGALITSESADSELVVTNLPDMPLNESAYGYFELVHEMTQSLRRCLLVRGCATEVITQFT